MSQFGFMSQHQSLHPYPQIPDFNQSMSPTIDLYHEIPIAPRGTLIPLPPFDNLCGQTSLHKFRRISTPDCIFQVDVYYGPHHLSLRSIAGQAPQHWSEVERSCILVIGSVPICCAVGRGGAVVPSSWMLWTACGFCEFASTMTQRSAVVPWRRA